MGLLPVARFMSLLHATGLLVFEQRLTPDMAILKNVWVLTCMAHVMRL